MTCPACGAELEPEILEDMAGKEFHWTLRYRKDEPAFFCPNATPRDGHKMNLWTTTWIQSWLRMKEREKKFKVIF